MRLLLTFLVLMAFSVVAQVPRASVGELLKNKPTYTATYEDSNGLQALPIVSPAHYTPVGVQSAWNTENRKTQTIMQNTRALSFVNMGRSMYQIDNSTGKFTVWSIPRLTRELNYTANTTQSLVLWNVPVSDPGWQQSQSQLISYLWPQSPPKRR